MFPPDMIPRASRRRASQARFALLLPLVSLALATASGACASARTTGPLGPPPEYEEPPLATPPTGPAAAEAPPVPSAPSADAGLANDAHARD